MATAEQTKQSNPAHIREVETAIEHVMGFGETIEHVVSQRQVRHCILNVGSSVFSIISLVMRICMHKLLSQELHVQFDGAYRPNQL